MLGIVKPLDTLILPQMDAFFIHLTEENNIYGAFAKEITADEEPIFYELDIEKYLNTFAPPDYQNFIYRMARECFAEASAAYFTQAREWGFYNSGMDKRALYYL